MQNPLDVTGKVALVTGASSGIGAATAILLAELGAHVALTYHRNSAGGVAVAQQITDAGGTAVAMRTDVREADEVQAMITRTVSELGPIDILVNNAGSLVERQKLAQITEERWDDVMRLNLTSAMLCTQAVAPGMIERKGGAIVNVVSVAGRHGGGPGAAAYATAKGGLITFTKAMAKELAPFKVRVNGISPGVIDTPFHEVFSTPEMMRGFVANVPLGRAGTSLDCAKVIAFLASEAAAYVVGETIEVNGGQLML